MRMVVLFPGIGYRFHKPLLYYSKKLATECGYDTFLEVDYQIKNRTNIRGNEEKMKQVYQEACESAEKFLFNIPWEEYKDIVFISKSIGTAVAAHFTEKYQLQAKQIYYTPLTQTFLANPKPGIAFCGTADPWVPDVDNVIYQCAQVNIESHRVEGADHSLETGDVMKDIEILNQLMQCIKEYLQK
ncbi:MAG: alpha/beta hydrolase [Eubacterium sp.]